MIRFSHEANSWMIEFSPHAGWVKISAKTARVFANRNGYILLIE